MPLLLALPLNLACVLYLPLFLSISFVFMETRCPQSRKHWLGALCPFPGSVTFSSRVCGLIKPVTLHGGQTGISLWTLGTVTWGMVPHGE